MSKEINSKSRKHKLRTTPLKYYSGSVTLFRKKTKRRSNRSKRSKGPKVLLNKKRVLSHIFTILFLLSLIYAVFTGYERVNAYSNVVFADQLGEYLATNDASSDLGVHTTALIIEKSIKDTTENTDLRFEQIEQVYILIWNDDQSKGLIIGIPGWVYYPSLHSHDERFVAVRDMGYLCNSLGGAGLIVDELESLVGVNINSYIWIDGDARRFFDDTFGQFTYTDSSQEYLENFVSTLSLLDLATANQDNAQAATVGVHTDLNGIQLYEVGSRIKKQLGTDVLEMIDLSNDEYYKSDILSSGTEIKRLVLTQFDDSLEKHFTLLRSRAVEKEQAKVEVYNASSISGLAGDIGRQIGNSGLNLVRAGNSPQDMDVTTIYVTKPEEFQNSLELVKTVTKRVLGRHYWVNDQLVKRDVEIKVVTGRPEFLTTGDIVVVIGGQ